MWEPTSNDDHRDQSSAHHSEVEIQWKSQEGFQEARLRVLQREESRIPSGIEAEPVGRSLLDSPRRASKTAGCWFLTQSPQVFSTPISLWVTISAVRVRGQPCPSFLALLIHAKLSRGALPAASFRPAGLSSSCLPWDLT